MKKSRKIVRDFMLELAVYGTLVTTYFFLVLHFLGVWLKDLYDTNKLFYAVVALMLIVCQGVVLEMVTTKLLSLVRSRTE